MEELGRGNTMKEFDEFLTCGIIFVLVLSFNGKLDGREGNGSHVEIMEV